MPVGIRMQLITYDSNQNTNKISNLLLVTQKERQYKKIDSVRFGWLPNSGSGKGEAKKPRSMNP